MKKYIITLLVLLLLPFGIVSAGVTDGGSSENIERITVTNYHSTIEFTGTFTDKNTGKKDTFTKTTEEFDGNINESKYKSELKKLKDEFTTWAKAKGATKITVKDGKIDTYYYDAHDEITSSVADCPINDLDQACIPSKVTIKTVLDKHQTIKVTATAEIPKELTPITFTSGEKPTYTLTSNEDVEMVLSADYSLFKTGGKVLVDEKTIDSSNYTSKSGSTVITLLGNYLETLEEGTHTVEIKFNNGQSASTELKVVEKEVEEPTKEEEPAKEEKKEEPKKENNNIIIYIIVGVVVIILAVVSFIVIKKKKNK